MNSDCTHALESLRLALEAGQDPDAATQDHLAHCTSCRERLLGASALLEGGEPAPAPDPLPAEAAVAFRFRGRLWIRACAAGLLILAVISVPLAKKGILPLGPTLLMAVLLIPILALFLVRLPGQYGLYKRLCKGRKLSGVCLGLAEFTRTPVMPWRVAFLLFTFVYGIAVPLYILLDLVMPVHPEDRPGLFRYRVARWWRGLRAA